MKRWWPRLFSASSDHSAATDRPPRATFAAVGYPKVGNTWLRLTLGHYLQRRYGLAELPLMDAAEFPMLAAAGCRAVGEFTHAPLEWTTQTAGDLSADNVAAPFADVRVVLLTRYPLDTLVSSYMQERHRNPAAPFMGSLADFIDSPVFGLDKLLRFHQVWAAERSAVRALTVWRYEDALADPRRTLSDVLDFLGEPIDANDVADAVERSSFTSLRSMELSGRQPVYKSSQLPIFATGDRANPDALHTRRGRAGGYRDDIPADLARQLEQRIAREMPPLFGYQHPPATGTP